MKNKVTAAGMRLLLAMFLFAVAAFAMATNAYKLPDASPPGVYLATAYDPVTLTAKTYIFQAPPAATTGSGTALSPWSGSIFIDVKAKHADAVVLNKLFDLTIAGKKTGFEADGFLGTAVNKGGKAVVGFAIIKQWKLFDQIYVTAGIGGAQSAGTQFSFGPIFGALIKF